jgi:hypothetical protein
VYNTTVVNNTTTINRVSYNGGNGGVNARPTPEEEAATRQRHIPPAAAQTQHVQAARGNPELRASANHGKPPVAATQKPGAFSGREVVPAKQAGAPYNPPANRAATQPHANTRPESNVPRPGNASNNAPRPGNAENSVPRPGNAGHARDLSPHTMATPPSTGSQKLDQKYQQQQQKLIAKQNQEHQKLQQQQEKEHQQMQQRNANEARTQQLEQRHQQQTQQLEQRHTQQQEKLQTRQQPPPPRPPKK